MTLFIFRTARVFFNTLFLILIAIIVLQIPLKGKSLMNHYLDETDNKFIHSIGNWINGVKKEFGVKDAKVDLPAIAIPRTPEISKKFKPAFNIPQKISKNKMGNRLLKERIPQKLVTPQAETYTAEEKESLNKILVGE